MFTNFTFFTWFSRWNRPTHLFVSLFSWIFIFLRWFPLISRQSKNRFVSHLFSSVSVFALWRTFSSWFHGFRKNRRIYPDNMNRKRKEHTDRVEMVDAVRFCWNNSTTATLNGFLFVSCSNFIPLALYRAENGNWLLLKLIKIFVVFFRSFSTFLLLKWLLALFIDCAFWTLRSISYSHGFVPYLCNSSAFYVFGVILEFSRKVKFIFHHVRNLWTELVEYCSG